MSIGSVNIGGGASPADLDAIRKLAQSAMETASKAAQAVENFVSVISSLPVQSVPLTYTGEPQAPTWTGYDTKTLTLEEGGTAETEAGTYTAKFKPQEGYHWWDETEDAKEVQWTIGRKTVPAPTQKNVPTYTGDQHTAEWDNYTADQLDIGGTTQETNAGTYDATFTPTKNYQWAGGNTDAKTVQWTIKRANVDVPKQDGTLSYTGELQTPNWTGYDDGKMDQGGQKSASAVGSYQATFTPKDNYQWPDGTHDTRNVTWTIGNATIAVPVQNGSLTYNITAQGPQWDNYDPSKMDWTGDTTGTNAGTYNAIFTPRANYQWPEGNAVQKTVQWTIDKAPGSLQLSTSEVTLGVSALSKDVTVTRSGNGTISAVSKAQETATVRVVGNTVTITGVASGSTTVTVSVGSDNNYTAPAPQDITVQVNIPSTNPEDATPSIIQEVARAGKGEDYWKAGDRVKIKLNGTVGTITLNGDYYATIIGFNHNPTAEDPKSIDFQLAANADGTPLAFVDARYNTGSNTSGFIMNTRDTNAGGWKSSYMYTTVCPSMLAAMPAEWQNIIVGAKKWTDNTGGGSDAAGNVTLDTGAKIWLLSEFEVQGSRSYANSHEKDHQVQYAYYANGNHKVRYRHDQTGTACYWWLRSPYYLTSYAFCITNTDGSANNYSAANSRGFAPGFRVA